MLSRGEAARAPFAINEQLDPACAVLRRHPHVVGGTLIAECGGQGIVDREMRGVAKGQAKLPRGLAMLDASMQHRREVGGREVTATVTGVGRGRDGRGIGGPHRRGRADIAEQRGVLRPGGGKHGIIVARKAKLAQPCRGRPVVREQQPLRQAEFEHATHLGDALQGRRARGGDSTRVAGRGEVAERQPGIIMARADEAVEIDLAHGLSSHASVSPASISVSICACIIAG